MSDKKWKKTMMSYMAGTVILAACVSAAWFFPEAYGNWQDQRQIGKVQLSDRETIDFLDGSSLDQMGRWKMLSGYGVEADPGIETAPEIGMAYGGGVLNYFWDSSSEGWLFTVQTNLDEYIRACSEEAARWCACGLLPFEEEQMDFSQGMVLSVETTALYLDQGIVPVTVCVFYQDNISNDRYFTVILDIETKKAYYISAFGREVSEYMAEQLGYESFFQMKNSLQSGERPHFLEPDVSQMDFASACGAESADIAVTPGTLELDVRLQYDSFEIRGYRCVVRSDTLPAIPEETDETYMDFGLAVMFGPFGYPLLFSESMYNTMTAVADGMVSHEMLVDTVTLYDYLTPGGIWENDEELLQ